MTERRPRSFPEPEQIGRSLDLAERMRLFDIGDDERRIARLIWEVLEPEARTISQEHWRHWHRFNAAAGFIKVDDPERLIQLGMEYLRSRFIAPAGPDWVLSAERTVAAALGTGVPLTAVLAMTSAGASVALEILGRRHECSKEERHRINDVFTRLRSLECDVYSSVYASYLEYDATAQRESLGRAFDTEVAATLAAVAGDGEALQSKAALTAAITRGSLEKVSQVAAASEQSALTMREAALAASGLIDAIDDARGEVETAAEIATRAAAHAGTAVGMSEKLSDHARSIESILGLIRDIAGQTNLLALNATIEAARAGDAGRGFSVVAQEVKSLAHQTARATDDIATKIGAIQAATKSTVSSNAAIRETVVAVQESADRIRRAMELQAKTVAAITAGVGETALAAESISDTIGVIRADTETAANEIETVRHDASQLLDRFHDLTQSAATFTVAVAGHLPSREEREANPVEIWGRKAG